MLTMSDPVVCRALPTHSLGTIVVNTAVSAGLSSTIVAGPPPGICDTLGAGPDAAFNETGPLTEQADIEVLAMLTKKS
jgi:hypothetical protein